MTKSEMISKLKEETGLNKKDIETIFVAYEKVVKEGIVAGEKVPLPAVGHFEKGEAKERKAYINPRQKELGRKVIPAHSVPKFKCGKDIKEFVK